MQSDADRHCGWYVSQVMKSGSAPPFRHPVHARGFASTGPAAGPVERLGHVDALRLLAAGLVVLQHLAESAGGRAGNALIAPGPGVMGVVLFFLISGYVIPFSVRSGLEWRSFALRRLFRIYPLFLASLALVALGGGAGLLVRWADLAQAGPCRWAANLLLVEDYLGVEPILGVSWTLSIELGWYALFAAALLRWKSRAAGRLALLVPAALVAMALVSLTSGTRIPLGRPGLIHAAVLGWQVLRWQRGELSRRALAANAALFLAVTWFCAVVAFGVFRHQKITLLQVLVPWTGASALFLAATCIAPLRESRLLSAGALPVFGAASYSVYLLHPVAAAAAAQYAPDAFPAAALALTAVLAFAGYRWVELPGIALGRRLATPLKGHTASGGLAA